ncbi:glycerophosphodiester phosphodiesterase [bacterium]|nr:glycerophosphodiester phosphodiesterase [bacterium]
MVEIVGHRGASFDAPENTMSAIRLAWEQQADGVEFDVWLSKDGQIVLHHDKDTKKTAGVEKRVDAQTLAELQKLDFGAWKSPKYQGEPIALLPEALASIPKGKRVFIEVKCGSEIVPELTRILYKAQRPASETAIISFSEEVCAACVKAYPDLKVYWIVSLKYDKATGSWNHTADELITTAKKLQVHGLDLQACDLITPTFGKQVLDSDLELYVWTVNDLALAKQMIAAGVQGITTDKPGWLKAELGE